jgi:hypothetical protein
MTKVEATQIALRHVKGKEQEVGCELVLLKDKTLERQFGWVFFYDSRLHAETGDFRHALAGNAPIVVMRGDGKIHETGTALPLEEYLRQFE